MLVSLIVAMDENGGIGKNNRLPWHLSDDLKRFKALTMGHYIIMGRMTYESIGRPLPGRTNIVITRNPDYEAEGCMVVHSLGEALEIARKRGEDEVFVTGGREIFAQALETADRIYLTCVHAEVPADVYFPKVDEEEWFEKDSHYYPANQKNEYAFSMKLLVRKRKAKRNLA
jgi:dihydrofolate reductase